MKEILLAAAITITPLPDFAPPFCEVVEPIYVWASDMRYLKSTSRGQNFLDQIRDHNDRIIRWCGELPRTLPEEKT